MKRDTRLKVVFFLGKKTIFTLIFGCLSYVAAITNFFVLMLVFATIQKKKTQHGPFGTFWSSQNCSLKPICSPFMKWTGILVTGNGLLLSSCSLFSCSLNPSLTVFFLRNKTVIKSWSTRLNIINYCDWVSRFLDGLQTKHAIVDAKTWRLSHVGGDYHFAPFTELSPLRTKAMITDLTFYPSGTPARESC